MTRVINLERNDVIGRRVGDYADLKRKYDQLAQDYRVAKWTIVALAAVNLILNATTIVIGAMK